MKQRLGSVSMVVLPVAWALLVGCAPPDAVEGWRGSSNGLGAKAPVAAPSPTTPPSPQGRTPAAPPPANPPQAPPQSGQGSEIEPGTGAPGRTPPPSTPRKIPIPEGFVGWKPRLFKDAEIPKVNWDELSAHDRMTYMSIYIHPMMWYKFRRFDMVRYGIHHRFNCRTCHGGQFRTPDAKSPDTSIPTRLYPLDPNNLPTTRDPNPRIAKAVAFMEREVMPAMKRFFGKTKVSCFTCHARKPSR